MTRRDDDGSDDRDESREAGRTAKQPSESERPTYRCDLCGSVMLDLHCKLICEQCGYKRDCSDP